MSITSPIRTVLRSTRVLSTTTTTTTSPKTPLKTHLIHKRPVLDRKMSSSNTGNTPNFDFPERKPSSEEKALVDDILNLYQLNPISAAYAHYSPDAQFHDPIGLAKGLESVKAQFNSMPRIFSASVTKGVKYLDNPAVKPPSVQISLSQLYTLKGTGSEKLVNSLVTFHVDPSSNLITQHDEEWDAKPNTTGDDGFFGKINEFRKSATASMVNMGADSTPADQK